MQQQQEQHRLQEQKRQQMLQQQKQHEEQQQKQQQILQQKQHEEQQQKQQQILQQQKLQQEQEQLLQQNLSSSDLTDTPGKSPMRIRTTPGKNVSEKVLAFEKKLNAPSATPVTTPGGPASARSNPPNSARSHLPTGNSATPAASVTKTASA